MRRMLLSSAIALALVATLGVPEVSAQKGKEKRKVHPIKMQLICKNMTRGMSGQYITASAGDSVSITLSVENRTGMSQSAIVDVVGGIPGCMIHRTVSENIETGRSASATVKGVVPEDQSGILTVDVTVDMPKTGDFDMIDGSVTFGAAQKGEAPPSPNLFQRAFAEMLVRALLTLNDGGSAPSTANMSEIKSLYR